MKVIVIYQQGSYVYMTVEINDRIRTFRVDKDNNAERKIVRTGEWKPLNKPYELITEMAAKHRDATEVVCSSL